MFLSWQCPIFSRNNAKSASESDRCCAFRIPGRSFNILLVRGELVAERSRDLDSPVVVFHFLQPAEDNHTAKAQRPAALLLGPPLVQHAEGGFAVVAHRVDPVSFCTPVEIELSVLFAVVMVDGETVGVVVVPEYREDTAQLCLQDLDTFLIRDLLPDSGHFPKHVSASHKVCGYSLLRPVCSDTPRYSRYTSPLQPSAHPRQCQNTHCDGPPGCWGSPGFRSRCRHSIRVRAECTRPRNSRRAFVSRRISGEKTRIVPSSSASWATTL